RRLGSLPNGVFPEAPAAEHPQDAATGGSGMPRSAPHLPPPEGDPPLVADALWQHYRRRGIINRERGDLGALFDLGAARGEFVRAIGRRTCAWAELVSRCAALYPQSEDGRASDAELVVINEWLAKHTLTAPWLLEWASRAVVLLSNYFDEAGSSDTNVPIDR